MGQRHVSRLADPQKVPNLVRLPLGQFFRNYCEDDWMVADLSSFRFHSLKESRCFWIGGLIQTVWLSLMKEAVDERDEQKGRDGSQD